MPATIKARKKASQPAKPAPSKADAPKKQQMSDAAVKRATGKDWAEWCAVLDSHNAAAMPHKQIALLLHEKLGVGDWWAQMVTVGYERAKGLRKVGQVAGGEFKISVSKVVDVPVTRLFAAFEDAKLRRKWLGDREWTIRKSTPHKSMRITWEDGQTHLGVNFYPKGDDKSSVQLEHVKLPDEKSADKWKAFWRGKMDELKAALEAM